MREEERESKTDPAKTYAKKNRTAPPKAACESAMWQQVHLRAGRPARPLSAAGKRASEGSVSAMPYAGPPVDHQPVQGIRTPPLRTIHPLPPPNRGDGHDEGHPEPIRPVPPTEVGGPNGPVQDFFGPQLSAPSPVGSGFDGIGIGLGAFSPSSNPPDVNGRVGATQYVQWNNTSFAVFDKAAGTAQVAARVHVFERDKMILGLPARQVQKDLSKDGSAFQYGFLPADLDSLTPPPAGEASFVLGPNGQFTNRTDWTRVAVTWGTTPTITFPGSGTITTVGIGNAPCVNNTVAQENRDCVPQPSPAVAADYLDNISFHYMYRLAYRNFGGAPVQESLVASGVTSGSASTPSHGAVKWMEFRNAGSSTTAPTVFQSGTFDPDTAYRWLPSIAMDKDHNIALGYSKSSTTIKPGIYMTGRLGTDTINTMGAEATVQAGIGSQTSGAGSRWGDYSAMTLDPVD